MVKGINRQVIVVNSPDPKLFEQAIFLLREDAFSSSGTTPEQVIRQARQAADGYLRKNTLDPRVGSRLGAALWGLTGAGAASLVWLCVLFLL
ncbi:MAG: translation initiation factor 2 [Oscillospiraceae bacterium]|nr:translation initiation factor 2 [Oscillospiraceae bacterium]MBO5918188.1 translation initiation factor 2 [Oscillospiraceae bacterium]